MFYKAKPSREVFAWRPNHAGATVTGFAPVLLQFKDANGLSSRSTVQNSHILEKERDRLRTACVTFLPQERRCHGFEKDRENLPGT